MQFPLCGSYEANKKPQGCNCCVWLHLSTLKIVFWITWEILQNSEGELLEVRLEEIPAGS